MRTRPTDREAERQAAALATGAAEADRRYPRTDPPNLATWPDDPATAGEAWRS